MSWDIMLATARFKMNSGSVRPGGDARRFGASHSPTPPPGSGRSGGGRIATFDAGIFGAGPNGAAGRADFTSGDGFNCLHRGLGRSPARLESVCLPSWFFWGTTNYDETEMSEISEMSETDELKKLTLGFE